MFGRYFNVAHDSDGMPNAADVAAFIESQQAPDNTPDVDVVDNTPDPVANDQVDVNDDSTTDADINGVLGTDPDLSDLDPDARVIAEQRIRDMRADYTRKTQEVAEIRKLADQYADGDVNAMQQALEFTHRLQTDPEFRAALYQELAGQQGTPNDPNANQANPNDLFDDDDDIPSEVKSKLSSLEQRLAVYEQQTASAQAEARQNALVEQAAQDLDRQMGDIRTANPDIQDKHVDEIYLLGHATGGNLIAAHDLWRNMRNEAQAELIASKKAIPDTLGAGRPSSNAGTPEAPITTFEEAGKAATEYLNSLRQG